VSGWTRFYRAAGDDPRPTLVRALDLFERAGRRTGFAVDLGCGAGRDTLELLRRGWSVMAIDAEAEAIARLRARTDAHADRLTTLVAPFDVAEWPVADLVNSSYALPFCPPDLFAGVWERIVAAVPSGGRFCGQLFGVRDEWAPADDMNFHTRADVETLLAPFEAEQLDEVELDGQTALGDRKHWHLFHVVARKR
jgi:tellurite methyltransferase